MSATVLEFHVTGKPIQQGSKRALPSGRMVEAAAQELKPWREAVAVNAKVAARKHGWVKYDGALLVCVVFTFLRPPSVSKRKRPHPSVKPDIDKLERAILDGITDSNSVWTDDARVVAVVKEERYAEDGELPGAWVVVSQTLLPDITTEVVARVWPVDVVTVGVVT